jgi:outer membrane protein OmpA-like peptidoglycan-associated protein
VAIPAWPQILFDGDSATVNKAGKAEVAQIASFMVAHPTMTVLLTGYTDTSGTAAGRQALGLARAKAVQAVLVADGASSSRITAASRGGNDPAASSSTSQGRALNRRVTVTMTQES